MRRTAMVVAMAMLVSGGTTRAAQESVAVAPASPVKGGKVMKAKTMTIVGAATTVAADHLTIHDGSGKDWTFVIDSSTKIARTHAESANVAPASPVQGGAVTPGKGTAGHETLDVPGSSPVEGGTVIPSTKVMVTDIKEGQRVHVTYQNVNGTMHATQIRVM